MGLDGAAGGIVAGRADRGEPGATTSSIVASTTGTWNSAPADARTTFGLYGSTLPGVSTTRSAPAASAERRIVPRLPGSRDAVEHHDERCSGEQVRRPGRGRASARWRSGSAASRSMRPVRAHRRPTRTPGRHRRRRLDHTVGLRGDELRLALPAGGDRLGDEHRSLDDEATVVVTRTAAPDQAPQLLYS